MREGSDMAEVIEYDEERFESDVKVMEEYAESEFAVPEITLSVMGADDSHRSYTRDFAAHAAKLLRGAMAEIERLKEARYGILDEIGWPRYEDGRPVLIEDTVMCADGYDRAVKAFEVAGSSCTMRFESEATWEIARGVRFRRARDTWPQLMADISSYMDGRDPSDLDADEAAARGFVRRAEALAGGRGE